MISYRLCPLQFLHYLVVHFISSVTYPTGVMDFFLASGDYQKISIRYTIYEENHLGRAVFHKRPASYSSTGKLSRSPNEEGIEVEVTSLDEIAYGRRCPEGGSAYFNHECRILI